MLLDADDDDLEISARKVKVLCRADLEEARATGKTGTLVYSIAAFMRIRLRPDVRVNEQYNSLIRQINERCRNLSLGLMAARINLKKWLGVGTRGANLRWSCIRPRAEVLLSQLMQHVEVSIGIVGLAQAGLVRPTTLGVFFF
jgi:hypothetical protein